MYKALGLKFNREMFVVYRQQSKQLINIAYNNYIKGTENNICDDPKSFWKFVKEQKSSRQSCDEFEYEGALVAGEDAANAFAAYFKSVFLTDVPSLCAESAERSAAASGPSSSSYVAIDTILPTDLALAVKSLKAHSSAGPDNIPPYIIKDCHRVLEEPLLHIFNLALKTAKYPNAWKISRVTPIPKDGVRSKVENYRPIAVLSTFGKLFESILNRRISRQIRPFISESQHGFLAGKSTVTNHVNFVDYATTEMERSKQVDVAYFDFKKAFDRVHNDVLLNKFAAVGFSPNLLNFFSNYFGNRYQYVQLSGFRSDPYLTLSGVSQGSTLGPTQFLIMINDLPDVVESAQCLMFADDLKLFLGIKSATDAKLLQHDIDNVVAWSERNFLQFNASKCKTITFTRALSPLAHTYTVCGEPLERVTQIRDLGLTLDSALTFNVHINEICTKAHKSLGFVMRQSARFRDRNAITSLFYAFVRSKLEYNALVWDPHEAKYVLMLERVQKKFARFLYKKLYGYYPYLYPSLFVGGMVGLHTLDLRRKCAIMLHYFSVLQGRIDNPSSLSRCTLYVPDRYVRARNLRRLFELPGCRTNTARYAPTSHALALLNALIAQVPDVDLFHMNPHLFYDNCVNFFS